MGGGGGGVKATLVYSLQTVIVILDLNQAEQKEYCYSKNINHDGNKQLEKRKR